MYFQLNKERINAKKPKKDQKMKPGPKHLKSPNPSDSLPKLDPIPEKPDPTPAPEPTPAPSYGRGSAETVPPSPKKAKRKVKKEAPRYQYEKGIFELSFE